MDFQPIQAKQTKKIYQIGIKWLAWSSVLAVATVGGWFIYTKTLNRAGSSVMVDLVTVEKGNVEKLVNESGTVELKDQQTFKAPDDGTVEQIRVDIGDRVKQGQPLVILQDPERQTGLAKQQLEIEKQQLTWERSRQEAIAASQKLAIAQKNLQQLSEQEVEIRKLQLQLQRNREKVGESNQKLESAQEELQELEILLEKGFIPENEVKQQQDQILQVQSQLRDAELAVSTTSLELEGLQVQYQNQQRQLSEEVMTAQVELKDTELAVSSELRELERLRLEKQKIEQEIEKNLVKATASGKVLEIQVKVGDVVKLGDPLLTLGDPSGEFVKLQLSPLYARRVQVNQVARIRAIGPQAKTFTGRVYSISELASSESDGQGKKSGQGKVTAIVKLDRPSQSLIVGSQVDVEIILAARQDTIVVNRDLIQGSRTDSFVWVQDSQGQAQKRPVKLGLEGLTEVEVTSGLELGEEVVVPPTDSELKLGTPITAEDDS